MIGKIIEDYAILCLKYPDMPIESVFNRYMHLLGKEQVQELKPYMMLMVKSGEAARSAPKEIQNLIYPMCAKPLNSAKGSVK